MDHEDLVEAYENTHYKLLDPELIMKIGDHIPELDALLSQHDVSEMCVLTAWNPHSVIEDDEVNRKNQKRLVDELNRMENVYLWNGVNHDPVGEFPDEPGLWVLGLSRTPGCDLAGKWGQNAIVYYRMGGKAQLIWCNQ